MSTTYLYRGSFANARASNEAVLWRASHQLNDYLMEETVLYGDDA